MAQREPFLINPPKRLKRRRRNPVGETLVTIGANPMNRNPWFKHPGGHRIASLMRWGAIPRGRVRRKTKSGRRRLRALPTGWHRKSVKRRVKRRVHHKAVRRVARRTVRRVVRRRRSIRAFHGIGLRRPYKRVRRRARRRVSAEMFLSGMGIGQKQMRLGYNNPRRRKPMRRRRRKYRRNSWFGHRKAHATATRLGRKCKALRKRRRRHYRRNPEVSLQSNPRRRRRHKSHRKHSRRHYRRNPMNIGALTSGLTNIQGWAPLAVTGGLSAITGAVVPTMVGVVNPWAKLGVQVGIAIGGGMLVSKFVNEKHGNAWMIVGVSMVGYQLLKQFVLAPYFPQFAVGLGRAQMHGYNDYVMDDVSQEVGAYPQEIGAFPQAIGAYPGVGDVGEDVGAYPYDGAGY